MNSLGVVRNGSQEQILQELITLRVTDMILIRDGGKAAIPPLGAHAEEAVVA